MLNAVLGVVSSLNNVDEESHRLSSPSLSLNNDTSGRLLKELGDHIALDLGRIMHVPNSHRICDNRPAAMGSGSTSNKNIALR